MLHVIGTIELRETHTFERGFETAGNYERVECQPQTAALVYDDSSTGFLRFAFDGIVTEYHYVNRIGAYGKLADDSRRVGQPDRIGAGGGYAYNLYRLMESEKFIVRLRPGVEHVVETVPSTFREGETHTFSRITPADRTYTRKLDLGHFGHETAWNIVGADGEVVETIVEPSYQQGREADRNIIDREYAVALDEIEVAETERAEAMTRAEFEV